MPDLRKTNAAQETDAALSDKNTFVMEESAPKSRRASADEPTERHSRVGAAKTDDLIINVDAPFAVTEAYKALRTNIIFALPDEGGKIIGITSGTKGDGKSTTLLNTALSFADLGKRCIVVDCDLRLPTIAAKLGMHNVPGLTDVMVGNCKPVEAIRPYRKNLDILPAGTIPRDSTGLISSTRMKSFLGRLKEIYDYVFIDFPPVTTVTDAAILSGTVDGYLLVVRHEETVFKAVKEMIKQLRIADAHILGFVYNDAPTVTKKYYKSYGYYK